LLPNPPVVSSVQEAAEGVVVEHHRQPPFETPEHALLEHLITVQLGEPVRAETVIDGRRRGWRWRHGDVSVVPARLSHKEAWATTTEYVAVRLSPGLFAGASRDSAQAEFLPAFGTRDPLVHHLLVAMLEEVRGQGASADRLYVEAMAAALSARLIARYSSAASLVRAEASAEAAALPRVEVKRVVEFVEENHARRDLSLQEMSEVAGMGRHAFSRLFKRAVGLPPYQYVVRRRVEEAKWLLARGGLSLHEVALASGFSDQAHLNRHFRRLTGATPGEFRRRSNNVQ
jgi:AraC family transcriptional regulator